MKTFKLTADITFEAENIDDAFRKLSKHFKALCYDNNENDLIPFKEGSLEISKEVGE